MKKADVHDLFEYSFAKKVLKDVPELQIKLDKCLELLYNGREYRDIADVIYSIQEAKFILNLHYETYSKIVETKGKLNGEKNKKPKR